MRSGYWHHATTEDFAGLDPARTVAVLPVAAVEQHGPHLPLATDALIADALVAAALARAPADLTLLALPTATIGASLEHTDFAGTLSIEYETLLASWKQIGASVARAGVRKLVILNTHGGQRTLVDLAAVSLRAAQRMLVVRANYFSFGMPPSLFEADELAGDIHGGLAETSLMLHLHPELVRKDAIDDFHGLPRTLAQDRRWLGAEKPIGIGWMSQDLHPSGACGNAAAADAARGAQYFDYLTAALIELLEEVAAAPLGLIEAR